MVPKEGYWRISFTSSEFEECSNEEACLGSPDAPEELDYTGKCEDGYADNLC
jgi:hypothetical protein